ncbi:MAG: hypothetical protein DCC68_18460 [Planctomycetota bacterium]|nr:MAG: hypothetical protein DCC68_18460 [Planctomycetota bacterium]
MIGALRDLDRILRGDATQIERLREASLDVSVRRLAGLLVALGGIYGVCMGSYAVFRHNEADYPYYWQLLSTTLKVPALFLLTLAVTFPSLYVFNALVGSRLTLLPVLRLLVASLGVNLAVLASLGPIVAFFGVSTTSYPFMVLLNVAVFTVAGVLGLLFLLQTLHRLSLAESKNAAAKSDAAQGIVMAEDANLPTRPTVLELGALDRTHDHVLGEHVKKVFWCWIVVFALVGAQMGWVLRPFIGDPSGPFVWFRERQGNFFESVWQTLITLLSGG